MDERMLPSDFEDELENDLAFAQIEHTTLNDGGMLGHTAPSHSVENEESSEAVSWVSVEYFRKWFDVSTELIGSRLLKSIDPRTSTFYSPGEPVDLYGPFWLATTLIIVIACASNVSGYLSSDDGSIFQNDFTLLSVATTILYGWITILPLTCWIYSTRVLGVQQSLPCTISLFGYSLTPFAPSSIICALPFNFTRWVSVISGTALSSWFLYLNFFDCLASEKKAIATPLLVGIGCATVGMGIAMKFYFFSY